MASYCPKCKYKLSLIDLKPECPVCGVNLMYYGMEQQLKDEADKAEYEHALFQPRMDRLKSATIGSPMAIARLVICFLPILMTLIPMGKITVTLPFFTENVSVGIISIVQKVFMNFKFDYYTTMMSADKVGTGFIFFFIALVFFVLLLVFALVNIINLLIAGGPKGIKRNITIAALGLASSVGAIVFFQLYCAELSKAVPEIFTGHMTAGVIGVILAFIAEIVINIVYKKMNIPVKYTDVSQFLIKFDDRKKPEDTKDEAVTVEVET